MKFQQLYSSSKANAYVVTADNGKRLLIECGCTWAKLQKALHYDLGGIDGCILSHAHQDHAKAVHDVLQAGIKVYTGYGSFNALGLDSIRKGMVGVVGNQTSFMVGNFKVLSFDTNHDADDPLGFVVSVDGEYLLFVTDTSHITQRFKIPFSVIAIECSYDKDVLEERVNAGDINEALAKRLLTSHMEKQNCMNYLSDFCDLSKCREIHLLHMSGDNIDKEKTRKEFEECFFIETVIK